MTRASAAALIVWGLAGLTAASAGALAQDVVVSEETPIVFTADEMSHDRELGIVTASGHVEVTHQDRVLIADTITYSQRADLLTASGNVTLLEPSGDVLFANYMELSGDMKDGIVENIRMVLSDRSRVAASGARRTDGNLLEMANAVYSPCAPCPDDPTRPPIWQVKAIRVIHDDRRQTVEYKDAWLEFAGVPVAYTPYISHPDPRVKRKTGFLSPSIGGSNYLGLVGRFPFFINLGPDKDATVTPIYTASQGPVVAGQYRQRLLAGSLEAEASITVDSRDDVRGHLFSEARFDVDETWRWGADVNTTTDDTYLRRYNFDSLPVLTTNLFAEGFRGRNYAAANGYFFQGLRVDDDPGGTPLVLPMLEYSHVGEPGRLGARPTLDVSLLALTRTDGADTRRFAAEGGWQIERIGPLGGVYTASATLRGHAYHVNNLARSNKADTFSGFSGRVIPQASLDWRHPFVRESETIYQLVEPIANFVVSPYGGNPTTIPNEDSLEFEFDETNLFSGNRFTGLDRVEGGPRINYGMRWGVLGRDSRAGVLVGQSYRVREDDTFAEGTGLEGNLSDVVGTFELVPGSHLDLQYRTRLDKDDLSARRNEVRVAAGPPALRVNANYAFFEREAGSEFESREEIRGAINARVTRFWRSRLSAVHDLTADGGMRFLGINLTYEDECLVFSTDLSRTFFVDRDVRPTDSIFFRVTFKTLGSVRSGISQSF